MRKRGKILRIRPYNMANFSGGSGYMPVYIIIATILSLPAMLIIWLGVLSRTKEEKETNELTGIRKDLNAIVLPLGAIVFVICMILSLESLNFYSGKHIWPYLLATIFGALIPLITTYFAPLLAKKRLLAKGQTGFGKSLLTTVVIGISLLIICAVVFGLLLGVGDMLHTNYYHA